jgi:predicted membrane-bound spermidine synthase
VAAFSAVASDSAPRDAELAGFVPLLGLSAVAAAYEGLRQTDAYLGPGLATPRAVAVLLLLSGFVLGAWLGRRALLRTPLRGALLLRSTSTLGAVCAVSGPLWFWAFQSQSLLVLVGGALPLAIGLASGVVLGALLQAAGLAYRELGALGRLLGPVPLLGALALILVGSLALSHAGLWRASAVVGLVLAGLSLLLGRYVAYFSDTSAPASWPATLGLVASGASIALAQAFVPASVVARYPAEVVWAQGDDASLVVTSAQNTFQLFEARQLRLSSVDAYRLAESAVHPALASVKQRQRILMFGPAGGFLEREVLRYSDVVELVSVGERSGAAFRQSSWPQAAGVAASDPRLRFEVAEPLVWLEEHPQRFDIIVVSLPVPASYLEGKHYTRFFYQALEQHLEPAGVLVIQATSRASLPATFGGIVATLRSAGFASVAYEAPIPLQGALSFAIATRQEGFDFAPRALPAGLRFLDGPALGRATALRAFGPPDQAPISTLYQQHVVESWHTEQSVLGN